MKLKNLFLGALMTVIVAPAMAQDLTPEQISAEAAKVVKGGDSKAVAAFSKQYKKNVKAQVSIAKAYMEAKKYDDAQVYADKANQIIVDNPKKVNETDKGATYIMLGKIAAAKEDAGNAATWYQQAMYAEPKNPEGYRLYATTNSKSDPKGALAALELLRKNVPNYPVDLISAEIASNAGQKKKACEFYAKVPLKDMKPYQIGSYAFNLYMDQQTEKAAQIAEEGTKIAPRSATLNRLAFWANGDLKKFDKALEYADKLWHQSDSVKIVSDDYGRLATCYRGAGQFDKALEVLQKLADDPNMGKEDKQIALKQIAQTYSDKEDYAKAIPAYEKYMASKEKANLNDQMEFGRMCLIAATKEANAAKKAELLDKADAMFSAIAATEANKELGLYYRAQVATAKDPDAKKELAKPIYEEILAMPNAAKSHQLTAVGYLLDLYANKKGDFKAAVPYAEKLKELDPSRAEVADTIIKMAEGK